MSHQRRRKEVQAGDMRKPIHIYVRSETVDVAGGTTPVYTDLFGATVFAQDEHRKSITVDQAGHLVSATYHQYTVRWSNKITAGMYINDPDYGTQYMYIQGTTDPDGTRHWLQLTAQDIEG